MVVESSWNVMAHGDARERKWRRNWRMECVASNLHTTSERGVSSITTADAHTSAASSRINWRPRPFNWLPPFRRKTNSGFCACAIPFQTQSTSLCVLWRWRHCEGADSLCTNYLRSSFNLTLSTLESEWSTLLSDFGKHKFNEIESPPPPPPPTQKKKILNPKFWNSESADLHLKSSIPCISDQRIRLLNQPNSKYHIDGRGNIPGYFGKKYIILRDCTRHR